MKKQYYSANFHEYTANISDLSLSIFTNQSYADNDKELTELANRMREGTDIRESMHTHAYAEMFVCTEGAMTLHTEYGSVVINCGDIALMPRGIFHVAELDDDTVYSAVGMLGVQIDGKKSRGIFKLLSPIIDTRITVLYRNCREVAEKIARVAKSARPSHSPIPVIELVPLLIELAEREDREIIGLRATDKGIGGAENDITRFLILEEIINTNYTEEYDSDEIASRLFITRRHMDRLFKQHYGKTLREIIFEKRIELSKRLLIMTDGSIEKIAQHVGFATAAAFRGAFTKAVGMTPTEYRTKKQKKV